MEIVPYLGLVSLVIRLFFILPMSATIVQNPWTVGPFQVLAKLSSIVPRMAEVVLARLVT